MKNPPDMTDQELADALSEVLELQHPDAPGCTLGELRKMTILNEAAQRLRPAAQSSEAARPNAFAVDDIVRAYADQAIQAAIEAIKAQRPRIETCVRAAIQDALDRKART